MKSVVKFFKTTLIGGLLVVLPLWLCGMILGKSIAVLAQFLKPITDLLPEQAQHPLLLAATVLVLLCFAVGLIVRAVPRGVKKGFVQRHLLDRIPGYRVMHGVTQQLAHPSQSESFAPCLAEIEEALVPAFIVERHPDGRITVFVPSAPTPIAGSIFILTAERVHSIDVSILKAMSCISAWGSGSGDLLAAMKSP